jgi:hypothetical protein
MIIESGYQDFVCYDHLEIGRVFHEVPHLPNVCPLCRGHLVQTSVKKISPYGEKWLRGGDSTVSCALAKCQICGWWCLEEFGYYYENQNPFQGYGCVAIGMLKEWDVSSTEAPVAALRAYVRSHSKSASFKVLDARAFERLIADCLKIEYAPCEVRHVGVAGGNGDGGIDLYLIRDEEEWLVQVKRRLTDDPEPIETIRLLNGVLLREGKHKGLLVTSAQRFSRNASRETRIMTPGPYQIELITGEDVVRMIATQNPTPWEKVFSRPALGEAPWNALFEFAEPILQAEILPQELCSLFFSSDTKGLPEALNERLRSYVPNLQRWESMLKSERIGKAASEAAQWVLKLIEAATGDTSEPITRERASALLETMFRSAKNVKSVLAFKSAAYEILGIPSADDCHRQNRDTR